MGEADGCAQAVTGAVQRRVQRRTTASTYALGDPWRAATSDHGSAAVVASEGLMSTTIAVFFPLMKVLSVSPRSLRRSSCLRFLTNNFAASVSLIITLRWLPPSHSAGRE